MSVSTTLFHPRQTRKGAQCSKYRNCPLTYPCLSLCRFLGIPLWPLRCFSCLFLHKHLYVAFDSFNTALYVFLSLYCCYSQRNCVSFSLNIWDNINNMIFKLVTSSYDITIHLIVHLVREIKCCGPVYLRWMYPAGRYMKILKGYTKSEAKRS